MDVSFLLVVVVGLVLGSVCFGDAPRKEINSIGMELVELPAGSFVMGQEDGYWDQQPTHGVVLAQAFRMSVTEVTREQYRLFRPEAVVNEIEGLVCGVSWYEAVAFCEWLSEKEGRPYRLPTEAEWEYACRLGEPGGVQNFLGGVLEWCRDWYGPYPDGEQVDPWGRNRGSPRSSAAGCSTTWGTTCRTTGIGAPRTGRAWPRPSAPPITLPTPSASTASAFAWSRVRCRKVHPGPGMLLSCSKGSSRPRPLCSRGQISRNPISGSVISCRRRRKTHPGRISTPPDCTRRFGDTITVRRWKFAPTGSG